MWNLKGCISVGILMMVTSVDQVLSFQTAFLPSLAGIQHEPQRSSRTSCRFPLWNSREEEIAKLEEELRKLKEDSAEEARLAEEDEDKPVNANSRLEQVPGKDMILSETELMNEGLAENENGVGQNLPVVLGAVVALVGLIFFAQIPIGQTELEKYSATGSSSTSIKRIDLGDLNTDRTSTE